MESDIKQKVQPKRERKPWTDEQYATLWIAMVCGTVLSIILPWIVINNLGYRRSQYLKYHYCIQVQTCPSIDYEENIVVD